MSLWESVRVALTGLGANKMRSALTMLGVIIGVAAVIAMMAIAQGAQEQTLARIQSMGTNTLTILAGQARAGRVMGGFGSIQTLVPEDADAIRKLGPPVAAVTPEVSRSAQVKFGDMNTNVSVTGTSAQYPSIRDFTLDQGHYFDDKDVRSMRRVAVLGPDTAQNLFGQVSPIGKRIRISGASFEVIGLMKAKGAQGFQNPDDMIYVPYTTAMRRVFGITYLRSISVELTSMDQSDAATGSISQLLRKRHRILPGSDDDFIVRSQAEILQTAQDTSRTFTMLLAGIASVSLLVGGIGIMNIMLVSVTERTREIGVRKALGATGRDIMRQFLIEAVVLSVAGGLIGIALGAGGSLILASSAGWTASVSVTAILLAFGFAGAVGVFFGGYPAHKASSLRPIEALRYE